MNEFDGYTKPARNGFYAMLRTAGDAEARPVLTRGGQPMLFPNEHDALLAVVAHLLRYINGNLVRIGEIAGETNAIAEAAFKPVVRQKGKSRIITVAYKGQRQRCGARPGRNQQESTSSDTPMELST